MSTICYDGMHASAPKMVLALWESTTRSQVANLETPEDCVGEGESQEMY